MKSIEYNYKTLIVYYLILLFLWTIKESIFVNLEKSIIIAILSGFIKIFIWVLPVIVILRNEKLCIRDNLKLRKARKTEFLYVAIIIVLVLIAVITKAQLLNKSILHLPFYIWLEVIILAGLTEEIVFRGFILQKIMQHLSFWKANFITSLLFVIIHYPIWGFSDYSLRYTLSISVNVFILGVIFGVMYKKSGTLWAVIILHSGYNLFVNIQ